MDTEDAALLAVMDETLEAQQDVDDAIETLGEMIPHRDDVYCDAVHKASAAINRWHGLARTACTIPARTQKGIAVKILLLDYFNDQRSTDDTVDDDAPMIFHIADSLARDVLGDARLPEDRRPEGRAAGSEQTDSVCAD
jgi:hypothetical protein